MQLKREFTPEVVNHVLGTYHVPGSSSPIHRNQRSPLHIDFPHNKEAGDFAPPYDISFLDQEDPEQFNAIGSQIQLGSPHHLPVIDADGGAILQEVKGSKLIIRSAPPAASRGYQIGLMRATPKLKESTGYGPQSLLRDVLGDNGIDLEVFEYEAEELDTMMMSYRNKGRRVGAIVLRAPEEEVFDVADSTQEGHSHVYIQRKFGETDHQTLISELGSIGIVSEVWCKLTLDEKQGFLRTPWTEKSVAAMPS